MIIDGKKKCSICKELLSLDNFRKNTSLICKLHSQCNKCECEGRNRNRKKIIKNNITLQKAESLKQRFNLSVDKYLEMQAYQSNKCAICGEYESIYDSKSKQIKHLSVDHDHSTGKIRGLLCSNCNMAIGLLKENELVLLKAIEYLKKDREKKEWEKQC